MLALRLFAASLLLLGGCATVQQPEGPNDPLEGFNRVMYRFNDSVDRAVLKPAAQAYQKTVPRPVNAGVSNFFGNLNDVVILVNDLLQFKFHQAASDFGRITFNTTVGLAGFIDVASHMNLPKHNEDFGQTLGKWGIGPGPYLVLPLLGPSTVRDGIGRIPDAYIYPPYQLRTDETTRWSLVALETIDTRAGLLRASRVLEEAALDPYAFTRDAYLQRRRNLVHDGSPPETDLDPFDDPALDPFDDPTLDPFDDETADPAEAPQ